MKKVIKSRIFIFILGAAIFSGITGVVAYNLSANEIGYGSGTVADALDDLYNANSDILWVNTETNSTNNEFLPQTIDLDLSGYTSVIVMGYYDSRYQNINNYVKIDVGSTGNLHTIWNYNSADQTYRDVVVTNSGVEFKNGTYAGSTANTRSIPQYIIGIK